MPAPSHQTVTFDVHDAGIAVLLTDPVTGSPTYDTWTDIPGISQAGVDPEFVSAELKGDAKVLARKGKTSGFTVNLTYSVLSLDVQKALFGGTITDTTTVGTESAKYSLLGTNSLPYFKLAFAVQDLTTGAATLHVVLHKCQVTGGSLFDQQTDEFGTRSVQVSAIPTTSTDKLIDINIYANATTLSTAA